MTLYFYADETKFELDDSSGKPVSAYGYGVLITEYPVEKTTVIIEALENLKQDPDIHKLDSKEYDQKTISRDCFHACEDSKNAHSHLCTSIRKNIKGKFRYAYDRLNIYAQLLTESCLEFIYRNEPVVIIVEERNDFKSANLDIWIENAYKDIEKSLLYPPYKPAYFPEIKIEVSSKQNAGLQVTDFILWAINRTKQKNKDTKWHDRLEFAAYSCFNIENNLHIGGEYILRENFDRESFSFQYPESCLPDREIPQNFPDLLDLFLFIEKQLLKINSKNLPNHILHSQERINKISKKLGIADKVKINYIETIREIASTYIRLFDTFPLYANLLENDDDQWSKFLLSKKLACQLLYQDDPSVQQFCDALFEYKYRNYLKDLT